MKKLLFALLISSAVFFTGCPANKPKVPAVITEKLISYEVGRFVADYDAYNELVCEKKNLSTKDSQGKPTATTPCNKKLDEAWRVRNAIIFRLKRNIDALYKDFESDLYFHRATWNFLGDTTELLAATAINITNGERVKNIISVALTAFKGGRKSLDSNLFREKTTEVLISKMRASRDRVMTDIKKKMINDADSYQLDEALGDLINYFYAGTLQSSLQELAQDASDDAKAAKKDLLEVKVISPTSIDVASADSRINEWLTEVEDDVFSSDAIIKNRGLEKLRTSVSKLLANETVKGQKDVTAPLEGKNAETFLKDIQGKDDEGRKLLKIMDTIFRLTGSTSRLDNDTKKKLRDVLIDAIKPKPEGGN